MIFSYLLNMRSHPSWVCGLKQKIPLDNMKPVLSHPSWVCGLKLVGEKVINSAHCHTLRGCVD